MKRAPRSPAAGRPWGGTTRTYAARPPIQSSEPRRGYPSSAVDAVLALYYHQAPGRRSRPCGEAARERSGVSRPRWIVVAVALFALALAPAIALGSSARV